MTHSDCHCVTLINTHTHTAVKRHFSVSLHRGTEFLSGRLSLSGRGQSLSMKWPTLVLLQKGRRWRLARHFVSCMCTHTRPHITSKHAGMSAVHGIEICTCSRVYYKYEVFYSHVFRVAQTHLNCMVSYESYSRCMVWFILLYGMDLSTTHTHTHTYLPRCPKLDCGKSLGKGHDQKNMLLFLPSSSSLPPFFSVLPSNVTQLFLSTDHQGTALYMLFIVGLDRYRFSKASTYAFRPTCQRFCAKCYIWKIKKHFLS